MARVNALPYRAIRDDRVRAFWYEGSDVSDKGLPQSMPEWDADTLISVAVAADVDVAGALADSGLDQTDTLVASLVWSSPGTRMRGLGARESVRAAEDGPRSVTLTCDLPGKHLAESVDLTFLIALEEARQDDSPLSPSRAGAVLWRQTHSITLEGVGGRFPMQWVDFEDIALPQEGGWYLDWDPKDLHRRTGNALCLYLNSRHETLRAALEDPEPDDKAVLLFDFLKFDVGRSMLIGALHNDDLLQDRETFDEGTLGDTICRLIEVLFQDHDLEALMKKAQHDRARFDALLQDRLRLAAAF